MQGSESAGIRGSQTTLAPPYFLTRSLQFGLDGVAGKPTGICCFYTTAHTGRQVCAATFYLYTRGRDPHLTHGTIALVLCAVTAFTQELDGQSVAMEKLVTWCKVTKHIYARADPGQASVVDWEPED